MNPMEMEEDDSDMGDMSEEDVQAMLAELMDAEKAGDSYEADNSFASEPAVEEAPQPEEEMDPEKLKMLLAGG